ncbi:urea transporter [Caminibacter pacificus]
MEKIKLFFKPYSAIIFLNYWWVGVFLFILSFLLPSVGFYAIISIVSTIAFAEIIGIRDEYLKYGFYLYNSLLVGMGVGYFFDISSAAIILTILLSIITFLFSFSLNKFFSWFNVPILSFPFAVVSMLFYLASLKYTNLLSNLLHRTPFFDFSFHNVFIDSFFKSMGTILFLPYVIAGVVISIIIFSISRIMFFMAVLGFVVGVYTHAVFVSFYEAVSSIYNFNFILIAMALGGVFLIPHPKNYLLALIGVIISVVFIDAMQVFFNIYSLPVYTLPFNIIVVSFLILLYWVGYKYFNYHIKDTPEKSLSYYLSKIYRFGGDGIKIYLPFSGEWFVYQGFDGKWTHKGKWRYAYDFVIKKNGKTYQNDGLFLEDYYAFGKPVLAPVNGYVVAKRDDLPDNFIGNVDRVNNWGNYIIIKSDYGYYVEISHLMQNSINANVGDYVKVGDIIGKCGNSGYSPEPHIHIQVQKYAVLGSETLPFKFVDFIKDGKLYYYELPKEYESVEAPVLDNSMKLRVNFILDDEFKYRDSNNKEVIFKVKMNDKGEFYLTDGENELYFYTAERLFYFYDYKGGESYLKELFKLLPKLPLINKNVKYFDVLPLEFRFRLHKLAIMQFISSFYHKLFNQKVEYTKEKLKVFSKYGEIRFSFYEKGFSFIKGENFELRRINEKDSINH